MRAAVGPGQYLPTAEEAPWCTNTGHRIIPVWARGGGASDPGSPDIIRSVVRRMNAKFMLESSRSSGGARVVRMVVGCDASGQIDVPVLDASSIEEVEAQLGRPSGAQAVKYLIFSGRCGYTSHAGSYSGDYASPAASVKSSSDGSDGNLNRIYTSSAIIFGDFGCSPSWRIWGSHVTVHELLHAMGAAQRPAADPPPFATNGSHCTDGLDVLCYEDNTGPGSYSDTRCPANGYYDTPDGVPIDCGYDTYFNAAPPVGSWLDRFWNVAGEENPFLSATQPLIAQRTGPSFQAANLRGDRRAELVGREWRFGQVGVASPANGYQWSTAWSSWSPTYDLAIADVNGDGRADLVGRNGAGDIQVGLAGDSSFHVSSSWGSWPITTPRMLGDVNGDQRADLVGVDAAGEVRVALSDGGSFRAATTWGTWSAAYGEPRLADVDGDGRHDLVGVSPAGEVRVRLAGLTGFGAAATWAAVSPGVTALFGDVTGDGRHDLVTFDAGTGNTAQTVVYVSDGSSFASPQISSHAWPTSYPPITLQDVNGDRRADVVGRSASGWVRVALSSAGLGYIGVDEQWSSWGTAYSLDVADVNNDGRADLVGRNGSTGDVQVALPKGLGQAAAVGVWEVPFAGFQTADATGDGYADLLGRDPRNDQMQLKRVIGGSSLSSPLSWEHWGGGFVPWRLGDVNGDGRADLVGRGVATGLVEVGLSTGVGVASSLPWSWWSAAYSPIHLADVNGDGRDDLIGWSTATGDVAVGLSTGASFAVASSWGTWPNDWGDIRFADVDGDGRDDLVARSASGVVRVARALGSSFQSAQIWTTWGSGYAEFQLADMNGDARADLVGRHANGDVQVALSSGLGFRASSSWGTWPDGFASS